MKRQRIIDFVESLNEDQLRNISVNMMSILIDTEYIRLDDDGIPYWECDGEYIVQEI
jgi:hypothetical protein